MELPVEETLLKRKFREAVIIYPKYIENDEKFMIKNSSVLKWQATILQLRNKKMATRIAKSLNDEDSNILASGARL